MKLKNLSLFLILFVFCEANANMIRDSEIEETLHLIAEPIMKQANLKDLKIYLINDENLNAFTAGGNELYLNSAMITKFGDIDVVRGVIAHEIGHILGKHIIRQSENINIYNKVALSSIAIGLATSVADGNPTLATAIALGGMHFAERSILSYSRTFESSADQTALKLLEQSGHTSKGMIKFFEYMEKQPKGLFINPYDQTHPLSNERLVALKSFYQRSKFINSQNSKELEYKFARSAAKLQAFTENPKKLLLSLPSSIPSEFLHYMKAIIYLRIGDLHNSSFHINKLLELKPKDIFYQELKGQILFEFGKKEALDCYIIAAKIRPNDLLIRLSKGIVGITVYLEQPAKMPEFYQDLKLVLDKEPNNLLALYYLAIYYEKMGQRYQSLLNSALIAAKTGELPRAKALARAAIKGLKLNSPAWYKANDIILMEE